MNEPTSKTLFLESVERCVASKAFIPAFYKRFLASSDAVKQKFRFTDFSQQEQLLHRSLILCAGATTGAPGALREIDERARTHDRDHLDIEPGLYDVWLEAIINTASEFDSYWDEPTENAWRKILGHVIRRMIRSY